MLKLFYAVVGSLVLSLNCFCDDFFEYAEKNGATVISSQTSASVRMLDFLYELFCEEQIRPIVTQLNEISQEESIPFLEKNIQDAQKFKYEFLGMSEKEYSQIRKKRKNEKIFFFKNYYSDPAKLVDKSFIFGLKDAKDDIVWVIKKSISRTSIGNYSSIWNDSFEKKWNLYVKKKEGLYSKDFEYFTSLENSVNYLTIPFDFLIIDYAADMFWVQKSRMLVDLKKMLMSADTNEKICYYDVIKKQANPLLPDYIRSFINETSQDVFFYHKKATYDQITICEEYGFKVEKDKKVYKFPLNVSVNKFAL